MSTETCCRCGGSHELLRAYGYVYCIECALVSEYPAPRVRLIGPSGADNGTWSADDGTALYPGTGYHDGDAICWRTWPATGVHKSGRHYCTTFARRLRHKCLCRCGAKKQIANRHRSSVRPTSQWSADR